MVHGQRRLRIVKRVCLGRGQQLGSGPWPRTWPQTAPGVPLYLTFKCFSHHHHVFAGPYFLVQLQAAAQLDAGRKAPSLQRAEGGQC
jgi:hypothetical protein